MSQPNLFTAQVELRACTRMLAAITELLTHVGSISKAEDLRRSYLNAADVLRVSCEKLTELEGVLTEELFL